MTRAQAEREAVRNHRCPYCLVQPGHRCQHKMLVRVKFLKSPHIERMKLVPEWADELARRAVEREADGELEASAPVGVGSGTGGWPGYGVDRF